MSIASAVVPVGYKQTEIGVIPEDWIVISTFEACLKIQDGTHFSPKTGGNEYLYVTSKNIKFGYMDLRNVDYVNEIEHKKIYQRCDVRKNDLLLTKDGASTGNVAINSLDEEFSLLSSVAFLRFEAEKYSAPYFLQQFLSNWGQKQIQKAMAGNAITRLTLQKIKSLKFAVPTLIEQNLICVKLSDMDVLIHKLQILVNKKHSVKQGAMQELLTGKIRLSGFSGPWKSFSLQQIAMISKGTQLHQFDVDEFGIYPHINGGINPTNYTNKWNTNENSITISEGGNAGYVQLIEIPFWCGGHCYSVLPKSVHNQFLYQNLKFNEGSIMKLRVGSGLQNIQKSSLVEFEISFPMNIDEQKAIAEVLSDMDAEIAALEERLEKAKAIKQGMMQQLLTGKIRLVD